MVEIIETDRLILKALDGTDDNVKKVLSFLEKGKDIFNRYEMKKVSVFYTPMYQEHVLATEYKATISDRYVRYYVFVKGDESRVIGTVSCGNIMSEPYCSGTVGYKFDEDYWHMGYAKEAMTAMINEIFEKLKLHRLIAYVMEGNISSVKLIERLDFRLEGICEKGLKANDRWEDHRLYALLNPYS